MQKLAASWYTGHRWSGAAPSRESRCPPGVRRRSRLYWQSAAANPKRAPASLNGVADGVVASYLQIQDRKARCCWSFLHSDTCKTLSIANCSTELLQKSAQPLALWCGSD